MENTEQTISSLQLMADFGKLPDGKQRDLLWIALEMKQNEHPEWHAIRCLAKAMGYEQGEGTSWVKKV